MQFNFWYYNGINSRVYSLCFAVIDLSHIIQRQRVNLVLRIIYNHHSGAIQLTLRREGVGGGGGGGCVTLSSDHFLSPSAHAQPTHTL